MQEYAGTADLYSSFIHKTFYLVSLQNKVRHTKQADTDILNSK